MYSRREVLARDFLTRATLLCFPPAIPTRALFPRGPARPHRQIALRRPPRTPDPPRRQLKTPYPSISWRPGRRTFFLAWTTRRRLKNHALSYVKQHYMYFPISLCCRSHFTVMLFRQRVYSLLNISFKVLLGFGYTTGARVPCKVHFE